MRRFVIALLLLTGAPAPATGPATPPTARQIIRALLANGDVPLTVHPSCKGVGAEPSDVNLRDYVSGLLANFSEAEEFDCHWSQDDHHAWPRAALGVPGGVRSHSSGRSFPLWRYFPDALGRIAGPAERPLYGKRMTLV
jgi:hypothetical protein